MMVYILYYQWYDGIISSITSDMMVYILYNQWYNGVYPL